MTGSMTLLEASKQSTNIMKQAVIETLIQESPLLEIVPFTPFQGSALEVELEATLPDVNFRDVNETYGKSFGTDTSRFFGVTILGGEIFVDNYLLRVAANKGSLKQKQYKKFTKSMSRKFDVTFFDGDGTNKDFYGVNALIDQGLGLRQNAGANGAALTLQMLDDMDDLMRGQVGNEVFLTNRTLRSRVTALARETYSGYSLIDVGTDSFGRKVTKYNDTDIRIIGDDKDGNAILGFDETVGSSGAVCASIYLASFGTEENVYGLSGAGGSIEVADFGETEAAPGHLGRVEWYPGIAIDNPYSIVRLAGVTG